jgi:O-antigen/teichoic acid export membrane protein
MGWLTARRRRIADESGGLAPGGQERHVARGALLQQGSQLWGALCMLVVITVLGRSLTLAEFGVYGLLLSLATYVVTLQFTVEAAAVRALAAADGDGLERDAIFSSAVALYAVGGVVVGVCFAGIGLLLVGLLSIPEELRPDAREAVLALAAVTAIGWPSKAFQDALRGVHLFGSAAAAEAGAFATVMIAVIVLVVIDAPLWCVVTVSGSLSILTGVWCSPFLLLRDTGIRFRPGLVSGAAARELLRQSIYVLSTSIADLVIYSLDRVVLGAFQPAAKIGLYEAAVRPHNLLRQLQGTLSGTVVPVAAGYFAANDRERVRDLLVRGTRYVLVIVGPVTTALIVLAQPLLDVWLGDSFRPAALSLALLSGYWLIGPNTSVIGWVLLAEGESRALAKYAWVVALSNLALSLALTPWLGLEGVVLGTLVPYCLWTPAFLRAGLQHFGVTWSQMARRVWLPGYASCAIVAAMLIPLRLMVSLDSVPRLLAAMVAGVAAAWLMLWVVFLDQGERRLVRSLARSPLRPA